MLYAFACTFLAMCTPTYVDVLTHGWLPCREYIYRQTSNIRCTLVGNKIIDHIDVVGASPVGAALTTSSFSTWHLALIYCTKTSAWRDEENLSFGIRCILYLIFYGTCLRANVRRCTSMRAIYWRISLFLYLDMILWYEKEYALSS